MSKGFRVTDTDRGWEKIKQLAKSVKGAHAKVGVLADAKPRDDVEPGGPASNVEVALYNEFGVPGKHIPERSFIRSAFDHHRAEYEDVIRRGVEAIYAGRLQPRRLLAVVGLAMAKDIKSGITEGAGIPPPNAPSTFLRKLMKTPKRHKIGPVRAPRTLIDTGQLVNSITHELVLPGEPGDGKSGSS